MKLNIQSKKISTLKPAPYNPRNSSKEQEEALKDSLKKFGLVEPIIFNKQTGYIVGGHFRVRELKKMGVKTVDCVIVDLNKEDERELNIRLNANTGSWDEQLLKDNFGIDEVEAWGFDTSDWKEPDNFTPNYNPEQGDNVITDEQVSAVGDKLEGQMSAKIETKKLIICPHCLEEFEIDI